MAKRSGAELLLVGGHFNESVDMYRAMQSIEWHPKAYFATVGPSLKKYYETLGPASEFTFATSIWEPHERLNFPFSRKFAKMFYESYRNFKKKRYSLCFYL